MNQDETWRISKTYTELEISSLGNVRSIDRRVDKTSVTGTKFTQKVAGKQLKPQLSRTGYYVIKTQINGTVIQFSIHREVAKTFLETEMNMEKLEVDHIDQNKLNNSVSNLRWASKSSNMKNRAPRVGKAASRFSGSVLAISLDTDEIVAEMSGNIEMADAGFDYRLVSAVRLGKRKSHKGCYFVKLADKLEPIKSLPEGETWSKDSFRPILLASVKADTLSFDLKIEKYEQIQKLGLTPLRILECLRGQAIIHKGFQYKLYKESN